VRRGVGEYVFKVIDFTLIGMVKPGNAIEQTGLACAIRSDDGVYLAFSHLKTHTDKNTYFSKNYMDVFKL